MEAMGKEMEQMHKMLQSVNQSVEMQDLERKNFEATIKAFDAETKRISAVQASMSPEQIQDIVMGTVHGMITSGDLAGEMPGQNLPGEESGMPYDMPQNMPPDEQSEMFPDMPQSMPPGMQPDTPSGMPQGMPPPGMPQ